jgi:chromosome segregation ATPase
MRAGKWASHILEGTGSNPTQSTLRRRSDLMESPIIWSLKPSKSPCFPDRAYHMGATNLWIFELKGDVGKEATQSRSSRRLGRKASRSIAIKGRRNSRRSSSPEAAREAMASSSGSKPMTKERLAALEANMQHLRHQLNNLDDFLQNLDIDAGRRLEMLENDITSTKFKLSEELGKLRKDLKDPKQEFEERVSNLEQQMEQLNKEWKQERDQSKKGSSK